MVYFLQGKTGLAKFLDIDNPIFILEIIILLAVMFYQVWHSVGVYKNIKILEEVFDFSLKENKVNFDSINHEIIGSIIQEEDNDSSDLFNNKNSINQISLTETSSQNEILLRIKEIINIYLLNNFGASVNFSIIKDIIDREIEVKDDEISQSIPTPLYMGLAATMLGIIFGLYAMPDINADGTNFTSGINSLINGVQIAMIASLLGLACTTILSSFIYKPAKKHVQKGKNNQISYLLATLLPELIKAEDTGVSGLKQSLDSFSRKATVIVNNVKEAAINTGHNIKSQERVLEKIERLKVTRVSKINLELFQKLDENMVVFNKFSKYLKIMGDISGNLKDFATKTVAIDELTMQIGSTMENSNQLTRFLTTHFEKIESSGGKALDAVNFADSYFRDAIDKLTDEMDNRINAMNTSANLHDSHLQEIYNSLGENLKTITANHIKSFQETYDNAVPKFEELHNLKELPSIKEAVGNIEELSKTLKQLRSDFNQTSLSNRLNSIENQLRKRSSRQRKLKVNTEDNLPNMPTFLDKFKNIFKFRTLKKNIIKPKDKDHGNDKLQN